ncbi:MAG: ABC transporter ATP-binding protein [Candidatus Omnitrophota bacterium]
MSNKAVSVKDLNFSYANDKSILKDISFDVFEGETIGLIGPNGAGKTTLLLHLNGILHGKGEIFIKGQEMSPRNLNQIRKEVAFVFQDPEIQLFMPTVYEDVAFGPLNMGCSKETIDAKVDEALKKINMLSFKNSITHHLSLGEKRKVSLATVLSMEPSILILDEPSANLDPSSKNNLVSLLKSFKVTKIIASHDLDLIYRLCSRCILMSGGQIVADGKAEEVLANKALLELNCLEEPLLLRLDKIKMPAF